MRLLIEKDGVVHEVVCDLEDYDLDKPMARDYVMNQITSVIRILKEADHDLD